MAMQDTVVLEGLKKRGPYKVEQELRSNQNSPPEEAQGEQDKQRGLPYKGHGIEEVLELWGKLSRSLRLKLAHQREETENQASGNIFSEPPLLSHTAVWVIYCVPAEQACIEGQELMRKWPNNLIE